MSFLMKLQEEGQLAKSSLKKTNTVVTDASGRKFHSDTGTYEISSNASGFVEDTCPDPGIHECIGGIYIGSQDAAHNLEGMEVSKNKTTTFYAGMKEVGITHVLNLFSRDRPFDDHGIVYMNHVYMDLPEQNLVDSMHEPLEFIEKALAENGKVLVHCNAGVSRSASIIIAYLIKYNRLTFDAALERVRQNRPAAKPNAGFEKQLRQFEIDIRTYLAFSLE